MKLLGHLLKDVAVPKPVSGSVYSVKSEPRHMHNRAARCMGCWDRCKQCKGHLVVRSRTTLWCPACKLLSPPLIVRVSRDLRLRTLRSNCCNRRLRPANWIGWTDGRGTEEGQVLIRREAHAKRQNTMRVRAGREMLDVE